MTFGDSATHPHLRRATGPGQVTPDRFYVGDPIDTRWHGAQATPMDFAADTLPNEAEIALLTDAVALANAATRLEHAVGTRAAADVLALSFVLIEESLSALGRCCREAGDTLIAPGDPRESLATRFARASAHWPGASGFARPLREHQARILSALADTSAALQAAGAHCHRTHELIGATATAADRSGDNRLLLGRAA